MINKTLGSLLIFLLSLAPFGHGASGSIDFNGTTSKVAAANNITATTQRTYVFWAYTDGGGENSSEYVIMHRGVTEIDYIFWTDVNDYIEYTHWWSTTHGAWHTDNNTVLINTWNAIAITYDGSSTDNDATIRINFNQENITETSTPAGTLRLGDEPYTIGNIPPQTRTWSGQIVYLQVFNRILSEAEQDQALICPYSVPNGLVMAPDIPMNFDLSGNGVTFAHSNTTTSSNGPPVSFCGGANQ